jgi:hypothetical protein
MDINKAMIAMTTNSSINVNAFLLCRIRYYSIPALFQGCTVENGAGFPALYAADAAGFTAGGALIPRSAARKGRADRARSFPVMSEFAGAVHL